MERSWSSPAPAQAWAAATRCSSASAARRWWSTTSAARATGGGKSSAAADKVVEEIKAAGGEAVANYDSVEDGEKIVKTALDTFGRLDVVINNAGILRDVSFQKMTKDDWDLIYRVHVLGAFRCTHAAWPYMREQGYGRIIFTTSAAGIYGNFGQANYAMAKLALVGFSNTLALEGEKKNVQVNTIAPIAGSRLTETVLPPGHARDPEARVRHPARRVALPRELQRDRRALRGRRRLLRQAPLGAHRGQDLQAGPRHHPRGRCAARGTTSPTSEEDHPPGQHHRVDGAGDVATCRPSRKGGNEFIDVDEALGYELPELESSYDERDLALYALGVGAGQKPADARELQLVYERNGDGFYALPTYGVVPALNAIFKMASEGQSAPGLNYGLDRILHGEQYLEVTRPLPPHARLTHKARITDIFDKGKDAVVVTDLDTYDADTGELLVKNEVTMVVRGAGGWGGERGPSTDINAAPERTPDAVVTEKTTENQALLYRLSGDWNPLHVDPEFATTFGFDKPILHGLCTFGFAGRAVVNAFAKGDPRFFKSIKVRFAESVFPGETLKIEMWKESDLKVLVRATVVERDKVVISHAAVEFYPEIPKPKAKPAAAPKTASAAAPEAGGFNTAQSFEGIGAYVAAHPELTRQVGVVYQFKVKNPDSQWVLDLKAGAVKAGTVDKADCTLEISDADWLDMVSGKADPMKLFQGGKLKISGNVMASQKLDFLKKIDRTAAPSAAAAPAAAPAGLTTAASFEGIGAYVAKTPELLKQVNMVYQFKIASPDSAWVLDLKTGVVKAGTVDKADCTLALSDADWLDMVSGKADPMKLFQGGKLKITGNVMASQKLDFLKKIDRAALPAATAAAPVAASAPAASAEVIAPKVFKALQERLAKNPALAKEVDAVISFNVKDAGFEFTADLKGAAPSVKPGVDANATTRLTLNDDALAALAKGETVQSLYQHGQVRIDGELLAAHRLGFLKQLV